MITDIAYKNSLPLATKYAEMGLTLTANPSSLLGELTRLSIPVMEYGSIRDNSNEPQVTPDFTLELEDYGTSVEYMTEGTADLPSNHTLTIDDNITNVSKAIAGHIAFARNVVKPLVVDMSERLHVWKQENSNFEPSKNFNIVTLETPVMLKDGLFLDSIMSYKDKVILAPEKSFNLRAVSPEELLGLVMTGEEKVDTLINEWLSVMEPDFIGYIWNNIFTSMPVQGDWSTNMITIDNLRQKNVFDKVYGALAIYLIARKLFDSPDFTNENVTLAEHRRIAAQYRDFAGAVLSDALIKLDIFNRAGTLVVEAKPEKKLIKVNGDVYRGWLQSGGSTEVLLGLLVSGQKVYTESLINQQKDKLKAAWDTYYNFSRTDESNKSFIYFKQQIMIIMDDLMKDMSEDEREYVEANPSYMSKVKDMVDCELSKLVFKDMEDPIGVALVFIAKCRFYYTSAYGILCDINRAQLVNPDIDVREAALLAVIHYIAEFLADQITITK